MQNKDEQTVFVHLSEISCAHYLCYAYIKRVKKLWKFKIQFSHLNKSNIPGKKYSTKARFWERTYREIIRVRFI